MKYPIGIQSFKNIRTGGYVYVDKSAWVYELADRGNIIFSAVPAVSASRCSSLRWRRIFKVKRNSSRDWLWSGWRRNGSNILSCTWI